MDKSALFDKRIELLRAAAKHEKVDHVPILTMGQTWAISYAGTTAEEALSSPQREYEVYAKHLHDMPFDGALFFGMNRPLRVYDSLGFSPAFISSDGVTLQSRDLSVLAEKDIDAFIQDPMMCLKSAVYRRYPALQGDVDTAVSALAKAVQELQKFGAKNAGVNAYLRENVGVPFVIGGPVQPALEKYIFLRGFNDGFKDLRRRPEKVLEALEAAYTLVDPALGSGSDYPWRMSPVTTPTYLNRKNFEKFFWPTAKRGYEKVINNGETVFMFMEGNWEHVYDHLLEFPKGSIIAFIENGDFIKAKKDIGDKVALVGGMPVQLMREGTVQQNIDHVRNIIDTCGMEGIMFAPTLGLLSPGDVNPENMRAICEFVQTYRP